MATGTDVDVKEHPESFVFVSDMPGCKSHDVKVFFFQLIAETTSAE